MLHISVRGDSRALFGEILDNPAVVKRVYAAPEGCDIDDREAWAAANPGLGTIKQVLLHGEGGGARPGRTAR